MPTTHSPAFRNLLFPTRWPCRQESQAIPFYWFSPPTQKRMEWKLLSLQQAVHHTAPLLQSTTFPRRDLRFPNKVDVGDVEKKHIYVCVMGGGGREELLSPEKTCHQPTNPPPLVLWTQMTHCPMRCTSQKRVNMIAAFTEPVPRTALRNLCENPVCSF